MIVTPPKQFRPRPFALLEPAHRRLVAHTEHGTLEASGRRAVEALLAKLSKHVCYVGSSLQMLKFTTGALSWTLHTWRGRETRMVHNATGVTVTSLRGTLEMSENPFIDLARTLEWLYGYGVGPASLSSMSWALWRASLPGNVSIGFDPEVGHAALFGGRQEIAEPREYSHMVSADIRAAYPFSMASHDYALSLRQVSPETELDPDAAGLARARIYVPSDMPYAPLPVRVAPEIIQFQFGIIEGTWPWCELAAARQLGCEVKVLESWAPRRTADLFGSWWKMVQQGRGLPGASARVVKSIANSLWGQFGMVGDDRSEVRWADEAGNLPYVSPQEPRQMPHVWTAHIAAETTARVRSRLLTEGLYGGRFRPVHVDTDGMIIRKSSELPTPASDDHGCWRIKERMAKVDIKAPQLYRYTCGQGCGIQHSKWHYVASGMTSTQAPEFFRRGARSRTSVGYGMNFDSCLPAGDSADTRRVIALLQKSMQAEVM